MFLLKKTSTHPYLYPPGMVSESTNVVTGGGGGGGEPNQDIV